VPQQNRCRTLIILILAIPDVALKRVRIGLPPIGAIAGLHQPTSALAALVQREPYTNLR